jgi:N-hydroxyarylamine O-acetyltransferase
MKYSDSLYKKFLKILKISKRDPSLVALTELIKAHLIIIPFENISKIYYMKKFGLRTIPDFERYLDGISKYKFGGTCYSNNYYLNNLLQYLGYDVRLCAANMANPDVHIVNVVNIENRDYLVDLGYAAPFFKPIPLDLNEAYKIALGADEYILNPKSEDGYFELKMLRNGRVKHGYKFKSFARSITEFETVINDSFRESATFLNSILLVRFRSKSSIMIHNFSLVESYDLNYKFTKFVSKVDLIDNIFLCFAIPKYIIEEALSFVTKFEDAWN